MADEYKTNPKVRNVLRECKGAFDFDGKVGLSKNQ